MKKNEAERNIIVKCKKMDGRTLTKKQEKIVNLSKEKRNSRTK